MPGNWKAYPAPAAKKDFGSKLLLTAAEPIIKIPSSIITDEFNYLLNPLNPDSSQFKLLDIKDFIYDVRIKYV